MTEYYLNKSKEGLLVLKSEALYEDENVTQIKLGDKMWEYINKLYEVGNAEYDTYDKYNTGEDFLKRFHANKVYTLKLEDEYFCGIRANTFVIEYGYSENAIGDYFVITANHKGLRRAVVIKGVTE